MKKLIAILCLGIAATITAQAAPFSYSNNSEGFYFAGSLSALVSTDSDFNGSALGTKFRGETEFETGFGLTTAIGYDFGNNLRAELEYGYKVCNVDSYQIGATNVKASDNLNFNSLMVNVLYDLYVTDTLYWYNGGGIGVAQSTIVDEDKFQFAWQLMTGVGFNISENVALTVGYRLFTTVDTITYTDSTGQIETETPYIHGFETGIKIKF